MGTRSTSTFVSAKCGILIDPSAALALRIHGLPPHKMELERKDAHTARIIEYAKMADVIVVTHYHYDHHNPRIPEIFKGKIALLKHPSENINYSQKVRAKVFVEKLEPIAKKIEYTDGRKFTYKGVTLTFSDALPHGPDDSLGYLTMVGIYDRSAKKEKKNGMTKKYSSARRKRLINRSNYETDSFLYTSDVQGMPLASHLEFAMKQNARLVYCDGPLHEFASKYPGGTLRNASRNMNALLRHSDIETLILDHHLLRDPAWKRYVRSTFATASKLGKSVITAAEYSGKAIEQLEARRRYLFGRR